LTLRRLSLLGRREEVNTNSLGRLLEGIVTGGERQAESHRQFEISRIVSGEFVTAGQGKDRVER
jgi:hypothetical protein